VTEFASGITPGSGPSGIARGPGMSIWFVESEANGVGEVR
jgi:hypothetical protein